MGFKQSLFALLLIGSFCCQGNRAMAQTNEQLWMEYMLNVPFGKSYNFENAFTYSTLLGKPKWRGLDYGATLEYSVSPYLDMIAAGLVSYTQQSESNNTLELRPTLGTKMYFTPFRRIQTRLLLRLERRSFQNLETNEWDSQIRPRARFEVAIPLNQDSYSSNKLWYLTLDFERLFVVTDLKERFANRSRIRVGVGYRLNYSYRFELVFMNQQSRNGIDESFSSSDNIFRIRFKHYLRKSKPTNASGTGN